MIEMHQAQLTDETKNFIFGGFAKHTIDHLGFDSLGR